jgi:hypothetical protein
MSHTHCHYLITITAGYIIADVERLRKPMQQITDYLLRCVGVQNTAELIMYPQAIVPQSVS